MNLRKDDPLILDYMLKETIRTGTVAVKDLKPLKDNIFANTEGQVADYERYLAILEEHDIVEINRFLGGEVRISEIPGVTEDFIENVGFQAIYNEQEELAQLEELEKHKLKNEAIVADWLRKDYKKDRSRSRWAFIFGAIAVVISILTSWNEINNFLCSLIIR